jgi:glycosyltransferase involved in cell wall biosynthesis
MIEAMACGTPTVAYRRGAVPEVIEDGVTGYIVEDEDQATASIGKLSKIERAKVRDRFEQKFTVEHMADNYLRLYHDCSRRVVKLSVISLPKPEAILLEGVHERSLGVGEPTSMS